MDPRIVLGLLVVVLSGACQASPTPEDQRRLEMLRECFGASYTFKCDWECYLRVESRTEGEPKREELFAIFSAFWLEPDGTARRDSDFGYLNAYDKKRNWVVHLYWDPDKRAVVSERGQRYY